jgi:hypothetical protein
VSRQKVILEFGGGESGGDIRTSDPIPSGVVRQAEAAIVRTDPEIEIRMNRTPYPVRNISAPPHPFNEQNQPIKNDEESALPKWYTNMQRSPYSFKM